jgi:hypothetical protein
VVLRSPYTITVSNLALGVYTFLAVATDNLNATATNAVSIAVGALPSIEKVILLGNGNLMLTLNALPGRTIVIEASTNLTKPINWIPLMTNIVENTGAFTVPGLVSTNFSELYYRVREF